VLRGPEGQGSALIYELRLTNYDLPKPPRAIASSLVPE
jgi:hypothetical protein